jgi:hypothetical protein
MVCENFITHRTTRTIPQDPQRGKGAGKADSDAERPQSLWVKKFS